MSKEGVLQIWNTPICSCHCRSWTESISCYWQSNSMAFDWLQCKCSAWNVDWRSTDQIRHRISTTNCAGHSSLPHWGSLLLISVSIPVWTTSSSWCVTLSWTVISAPPDEYFRIWSHGTFGAQSSCRQLSLGKDRWVCKITALGQGNNFSKYCSLKNSYSLSHPSKTTHKSKREVYDLHFCCFD